MNIVGDLELGVKNDRLLSTGYISMAFASWFCAVSGLSLDGAFRMDLLSSYGRRPYVLTVFQEYLMRVNWVAF